MPLSGSLCISSCIFHYTTSISSHKEPFNASCTGLGTAQHSRRFQFQRPLGSKKTKGGKTPEVDYALLAVVHRTISGMKRMSCNEENVLHFTAVHLRASGDTHYPGRVCTNRLALCLELGRRGITTHQSRRSVHSNQYHNKGFIMQRGNNYRDVVLQPTRAEGGDYRDVVLQPTRAEGRYIPINTITRVSSCNEGITTETWYYNPPEQKSRRSVHSGQYCNTDLIMQRGDDYRDVVLQPTRAEGDDYRDVVLQPTRAEGRNIPANISRRSEHSGQYCNTDLIMKRGDDYRDVVLQPTRAERDEYRVHEPRRDITTHWNRSSVH
ncbi:hypothetical protein J6590_063356 [Homalodisca vitripennis]|nr:hypothetical protein J6590_063356 [Homalodisca vitripennis]